MDQKLCKDCPKRKDCTELCEEARASLKDLESPRWSDTSLLSGDYVYKVFSGKEGESEQAIEERKRKYWKRRKLAIRTIVRRFEKNFYSSLKYYFVWKLYTEEGIKQKEIAEIFNTSQPSISRMLFQIKQISG